VVTPHVTGLRPASPQKRIRGRFAEARLPTRFCPTSTGGRAPGPSPRRNAAAGGPGANGPGVPTARLVGGRSGRARCYTSGALPTANGNNKNRRDRLIARRAATVLAPPATSTSAAVGLLRPRFVTGHPARGGRPPFRSKCRDQSFFAKTCGRRPALLGLVRQGEDSIISYTRTEAGRPRDRREILNGQHKGRARVPLLRDDLPGHAFFAGDAILTRSPRQTDGWEKTPPSTSRPASGGGARLG